MMIEDYLPTYALMVKMMVTFLGLFIGRGENKDLRLCYVIDVWTV